MSIHTNTPRLLTAGKEFNIGKDTLIAFLQSRDFNIEAMKPNAKLTPEMYNALQSEFSQNIAAKRKSDAIELPKPNSFRESNTIKSDANLGNIEDKEVTSNNSSIKETGREEEFPFLREYLLTQNAEVNLNIPIEKDIQVKEVQIEEQVFELEQKLEDELMEQFSEENPFESSINAILNQKDIFRDREKKEIQFENKNTISIFSDFEAFSICLGLTDSTAQSIARKFFNNPNNISNKIEAHDLAMETLEKYGTQVISNIIQLPPLPFQAIDASQIFSELDTRLKSNKSPNIRILFKDEGGESKTFIMSFYKKDKRDYKVRTHDYISVRTHDAFFPIMTISRSGFIIIQENSKKIIPILQLFIRFSKDTHQMILNYGLETGECSICGRKLTDSVSIRLGIGPVCGGRR